MKAHEVILK